HGGSPEHRSIAKLSTRRLASLGIFWRAVERFQSYFEPEIAFIRTLTSPLPLPLPLDLVWTCSPKAPLSISAEPHRAKGTCTDTGEGSREIILCGLSKLASAATPTPYTSRHSTPATGHLILQEAIYLAKRQEGI
ncbi:MAG: hypothetical protein CMP47_14045, partial [Rickettsiales bacterium]|nr:hypothetical protein [Rickettsiales bacterium]